MRQRRRTHEIQFDRPERDLGRSEVDAVSAEIGNLPHSRSLCEIQER